MREDGYYWIRTATGELEVAHLSEGYWQFTWPFLEIPDHHVKFKVVKKIHPPKDEE